MARKGGPEPTPGIVVVDKPAGWTSHDVVARMRRLASTSKVGHAGTLDPMATGVLVLAIGKATRLLTYIVGNDKEYEATIRLGVSTITDDAEGDTTATVDASGIEDDAIAEAIARLTGEIDQVPSAVSAIKVNGQRSYARVRAGEDVQLAARPVTVSEFTVVGVRRPDAVVDIDVRVTVSSGTYVRALARDLGAALGVGGHLTALRRTRVGRFELARALTLDELGRIVDAGEAVPRMSLIEAASLIMDVVVLAPREASALGYGQDIVLTGEGDALAAADDQAIAVIHRSGGKARPVVVFAPAVT